MTTLQAIIALILAPTTIVAILGYLMTKFFEKLLLRDVEKFKAQLQHESEQSKMRLENELHLHSFEYQTRFSLFHNKRVEVISELYKKLYDATVHISQFVSPLQFEDGRSVNEKNAETAQIYNDMSSYYGRHRIYLDEEVCKKFDSLLQTMHKVVEDYYMASEAIREKYPDAAESRKLWREAWLTMRQEIPAIQRELETQFREAIAVNTPTPLHE